MNTRLRRWGQRWFELSGFRRQGLEVLGKDVLEIGCGSGYGACLLNALEPKSYLGLDVMPEQIAIARENYPQFEFLVQDATDLSQLPNAGVDIVVIFGVLHHILEWRKVLAEVARLLRPGGDFFVEEPRRLDMRLFDQVFHWGHPDSDFSLQAFEGYLRQVGLKIVRRRWTPVLTQYHIHKSDGTGA
jgi:ubiquinone/menaquinone biosynthesis C-methylase UbiE